MTDYTRSMIRTFVPVMVGSVVTWLAARGISVDVNVLLPAVDALVATVYYGVVRLMEARWPKTGLLLGAVGAPQYKIEAPIVKSVSESSNEIAPVTLGQDVIEKPNWAE
jgi:hypothetical protein